MKIITVAPDHIYIKANVPKAGMLETDSKKAAVEKAEVVMVGEGVTWPKVGDTILWKSWSGDVFEEDGQTYIFIDLSTGGVKAVVQ